MKKIICACMIVALLICVAACGAGKPNGRYAIDSMEMAGTKLTADQMKSFGMEMSIVFNSDGTGAIVYGSGDETDEETFTWDEKELFSETGSTIGYTFDGSSVTLSEDGTTIIFK